MLEALKFVQGAVSKKDLLPALTHFRIEGGKVRSFNGTLALCCPISLDIDCVPKAIPFIKAITNCEETVTLSMTAAGRLGVKSGPFKAFIDCVHEETPHVLPEGEIVDVDGEELLKAAKLLLGFVGEDATKPWSNGVLIKDQSAFATDNLCLVEYWLGSTFPYRCNLPKSAIKEIVRINEPPTHMQVCETSITFHYEEGKWVRTALLNAEWPDVERILDVECEVAPMPPGLFGALEAIKPFVDKMERVYINGGTLSTSIVEGDGASYDVEDLQTEGVYNRTSMAKLKGIADKIDFDRYPKPAIFYGNRLRGTLLGYRA